MTIDKRMMTNFTLEALQNTSINQLVFEACMEHVYYDGVELKDDGKVLRLRDAADNELIEIKLGTDGTYELATDGKFMNTDTFEQALVEGLYLEMGRINIVVDKMVAQDVDPRLNQKDYDGIKLKYATTTGKYRHGCGDELEKYGAKITGHGGGIDVYLHWDDRNWNWKGHATNKRTGEFIGYNTPDLKSILEDITHLQSNGVQRVSQTYKDSGRFNTPEQFDTYIEEVQQDAQPNWDFAEEQDMQK